MAISHKAAVLTGLLAVGHAMPMSPLVQDVFRRQEAAVVSTEQCTNEAISTPEGAARVWNDNGVGARLDEYLSSHGEANWLNDFANEFLPGSGDTGSVGCGFRDQSCVPGATCASLGNSIEEFWILNAVQKMQGMFEHAHENLQDHVIDSSLTISSITSDFAVTPTPNDKILKYVAAAFGIAGGMVGYGSGPVVNALKTSATMFGGFMAAGAANGPAPAIDPTKAMDVVLKEIFASQSTYLDNVLELAVGGEGDYATLPDQGGDYATSVARFFADGRFVMQGDLVASFFSQGYANLNKKLVDVALKEYGYRLLNDANYLDADSCNGLGDNAHWLDIAGGRCMRLARFENSLTGKWLAAEDSIATKLAENHGMDVYGYFNSLVDCAVNGVDGEVDETNLPTDGSIPRCFYNVPAQDAETCLDEEGDHEWYFCWLKDDFTESSPPESSPPEEPEEPTEEEGPTSGADQLNEDTGCYSGGLNWADLHGSAGTDEQELVDDINTQCQMVDGLTFELNSFWWSCTEWTTDDGAVNHIWWEIQTEADDADSHTLTYDVCNSAFTTELGGCASGSQQTHDQFWFKMDPNEGACPYKGSKFVE